MGRRRIGSVTSEATGQRNAAHRQAVHQAPLSAPLRVSLRVPLDLLLVAVGGAVGTLGRYFLSEAMLHMPNLAVLTANLAGALVLGLLVALLAGRHARLQLLLGTGLCGGFTTYSAFAMGVEQLAAAQPWAAVGFAIGTVIAGVICVACGVWIGGALRRIFGNPVGDAAGDAAPEPHGGAP